MLNCSTFNVTWCFSPNNKLHCGMIVCSSFFEKNSKIQPIHWTCEMCPFKLYFFGTNRGVNDRFTICVNKLQSHNLCLSYVARHIWCFRSFSNFNYFLAAPLLWALYLLNSVSFDIILFDFCQFDRLCKFFILIYNICDLHKITFAFMPARFSFRSCLIFKFHIFIHLPN